MTMSFSEQLRTETQPIWTRIFSHPFINEMEKGTLPLEKFRYYIIQDFHYLAGFGRAVSIALSKAPDAETASRLARRIHTPVERPVHVQMFRLLEIESADAERATPSPTNRAYINHMITTASTGSVGDAAASLLPCPWTYHELGARLSRSDHPIFGPWAEAYSSGLLEASTAAWRELVDCFGADAGPAVRDSMRRAFLISSRYEFLFWTMGYNQEQWP